MAEMDRKLRQVAQLRAIWRGFREPQERCEDERLSRTIIEDGWPFRLRESASMDGVSAVRATIRRWWCEEEYAAIVAFGEQLDAPLLDADPLVRIYIEGARARLTKK